MATVTHHLDCDGYRFAHVARAVPVHPHMVRAECERCDWRGQLYGTFRDNGESTKRARREAGQHAEEVRCDGRCQDWN